MRGQIRCRDRAGNSSFNTNAGGKHDKSDLFISMTMLSDVEPDDPVMQEEIFGPLLPFVTVESPGEAVEFINDREKPLGLYVFTEDKKIQVRFCDTADPNR